MIRLKLPAEMSCDHEGCLASIDCRLILLGTGGFGFAAIKGAPWQVALARGNPGSPYLIKCPQHVESIITVPSDKKVIADAH